MLICPYIDTTSWPTFNIKDFMNLPLNGVNHFILAFIVGGGPEGLDPTWGGYHAAVPDSSGQICSTKELWFKDQIDILRMNHGDVAISFGGQAGKELAITNTNDQDLLAKYQAVMDAYSLKWVDFDIEGVALTGRPVLQIIIIQQILKVSIEEIVL